MALRSLLPIEDIRVAHVNSEDNSTTYESGVAYKAGTLVTYEGASYVAATDISDDDTDTPNAAPLKWGLVPNAFTSGGDDSGLASRVSALEEEMPTKADKSFTDELINMRVVKEFKTVEITTDNDTYASACAKLMVALNTAIAALPDDCVLTPLRMHGAYTGMVNNGYAYSNTDTIPSLLVTSTSFTDSWASANWDLIRLHTDAAEVHWNSSTLRTGGASTFAVERASASITNNYKLSFRCVVFKKLVTE